MNYILYIGIIFYLFITTTVAERLGIESVGTASTLLLVISIFYKLFLKYKFGSILHAFNIESKIIVLGVVLLLIKLITNDLIILKQILFFVIIPPLVSILVSTQNIKSKNIISKIIILFFVAECLLAIYERTFTLNVFPYEALSENIEYTNTAFRSTAFLGHPLSNALCVSIIMGFILTSDIKNTNKIALIALGYIAIMAFNARAGMIIWAIVLLIYFLHFFFKNKNINVSFKATIILITFSLAIYHLVKQGFGDRFFNDQILDGSAMTRVEVFRAFEFISSTDFWLGNSSNYLPVMEELNAGGVENSYIVIILNYGIVAALILFALYFSWIKRFLKNHTRLNKFVITMAFIIVGSTNNALAGSSSWMIFVLCMNSFRIPR